MGETLIIGGGAIGLSLAYHLAHKGEDVTLLERHQLTSGTSWHAAGIVGPLRATPNMTKLAMYAGTLFPALEQECGLSTGYKKTGGYWLAREDARMDELHRIASLGRHFGLTPTILARDSMDVPGLDVDGIVGALHVEEDANVNPVDLCMAYAKCARAKGAVIREGVEVADLLVEGDQVRGVRLTDGTEIGASRVALCAGAWSRKLAQKAGVALPLQAVEHMYVVTEPVAGLPNPYPVLRDLDRGFYVKGDAGRLVIGGFEPDAKCWDPYGQEGDRPFLEMPEDWDQFTPFMEGALSLIPALEHTGIQRFMNGPESFTVDTRPLIGAVPELEGLYVAAGMNSVGVMSSAGVGRVLADWMVEDAAPMDLWEVDVARVDPLAATATHVETRMEEAVADAFALHWPFKQPKAGRGLRKSVLHDRWASCGAQFGLTAGWERGLWYAKSPDEVDLPYSIGAQPWQDIVHREAAIMNDGTALVDLTPFGKFEVAGTGALDLLQWLCAANIDVSSGHAVYTQMLNERGGIEADLTVTRLGAGRFRVTSGAATRRKDMAWLKRHSYGDVTITDVTDQEAVIGVMGGGSRDVLARISNEGFVNFPFSSARYIQISDVQCLATRISFVGEMGWELSIPIEGSCAVFDALQAAGARPMGHFTVDACRIEKGFRHWGHDLGPDISPLEAGLGFCIAWDTEFLGKPALSQQRNNGLTKRMVLLGVSGNPLILHDEPIWENHRVVGLTTSGGIGARTRRNLALGLVDTLTTETKADLLERTFEIEIAGQMYPAQGLAQVPFDPSGKRMRA